MATFEFNVPLDGTGPEAIGDAAVKLLTGDLTDHVEHVRPSDYRAYASGTITYEPAPIPDALRRVLELREDLQRIVAGGNPKRDEVSSDHE